MKLRTLLVASTFITSFAMSTAASALDVNITADLPSVDVMHGGQKATIMRNQNPDNNVNPAFAKTSRKCPPFCIQPVELAPSVKTIAELEMLQYLQKVSAGDKTVMVIDSRTPDWVEKGTIPGTVNIPWDKLNIGKSDPITVQEILIDFLLARTDPSGHPALVVLTAGGSEGCSYDESPGPDAASQCLAIRAATRSAHGRPASRCGWSDRATAGLRQSRASSRQIR